MTNGDWTKPARKLLGKDAGLDAVGKLAAALYAAASDFSPGGKFRGAELTPHELETAFRPPADLPGRVAREGPFTRAV